MKMLYYATVILIAILAMIPMSCSSNGTGTTTEIRPTVYETPLLDMMKSFPYGLDVFVFIDQVETSALPGAQDLLSIAKQNAQAKGVVMLSPEETRYAGLGWKDFRSLGILSGNFTKDRATQLLSQYPANARYEYRGVTIWKNNEMQEFGTVLGNIIIGGEQQDIELCIDLKLDGSQTLFDDDDFREMAETLPHGIHFQVLKGRGLFFLKQQPYEGLDLYARTFVRRDDGTMEITELYRFQDSQAARTSLDSISKYTNSTDTTSLISQPKITQKDHYIEANTIVNSASVFSVP